MRTKLQFLSSNLKGFCGLRRACLFFLVPLLLSCSAPPKRQGSLVGLLERGEKKPPRIWDITKQSYQADLRLQSKRRALRASYVLLIAARKSGKNCVSGARDTNTDGKIDERMRCYENGNRKHYIKYNKDGTKKEELTYYRDASVKTRIKFHEGTNRKLLGYPHCYISATIAEGLLRERNLKEEKAWQQSCEQGLHGCVLRSKSCLS